MLNAFKKYGCYILMILAGMTIKLSAAERTANEYEFKAACIYNFLSYTAFPADKEPADEEKREKKPIRIVVMGQDPFDKAWKIISSKKIRKRPINIVRLPSFSRFKEKKDRRELRRRLASAHVLFLPRSEENHVPEILELIPGLSILTIGESHEFLEKGGMINFLRVDDRIQFEVNLNAARRARLQIKTIVLKLAHRVIQAREKQDDK